MKKTVTVSLPVYNGEKFILDALQSIINQTVKVDKIIICDNCSDDLTSDIVNKFISDHIEFDIEYHVNDENIGFQNNFIKCYDLASTDFLLILHVDDILKPSTIEKQTNFFNENPEYAIVGGGNDAIDEQGKILKKAQNTKTHLFKKNEIYEFIKETASWIPFSSVMYNLKHTKKLDFLSEISVGPDELYWPLLLQKHPIAILGESLVHTRWFPGQMRIKNSISMFDDYMLHFKNKIDRAYLEIDKERQEKTKKLIKNQVSRFSISLGRDILKYKRNYNVGLKYFIHGIVLYPGIIFTKFFSKSLLRLFSLID